MVGQAQFTSSLAWECGEAAHLSHRGRGGRCGLLKKGCTDKQVSTMPDAWPPPGLHIGL